MDGMFHPFFVISFRNQSINSNINGYSNINSYSNG